MLAESWRSGGVAMWLQACRGGVLVCSGATGCLLDLEYGISRLRVGIEALLLEMSVEKARWSN